MEHGDDDGRSSLSIGNGLGEEGIQGFQECQFPHSGEGVQGFQECQFPHSGEGVRGFQECQFPHSGEGAPFRSSCLGMISSGGPARSRGDHGSIPLGPGVIRPWRSSAALIGEPDSMTIHRLQESFHTMEARIRANSSHSRSRASRSHMSPGLSSRSSSRNQYSLSRASFRHSLSRKTTSFLLTALSASK